MSMKVLIIDSDWRFVERVREYLEGFGHYVVHQPDAKKALQQVSKWRPDIIMVDCAIEACSNGDLLQVFGRLIPRPAVLLTSYMDDFQKAWRAWQHGGDELLFKPILHISELHTAIITAMRNASCPSARPRASRLALSA